MGSVGNTYHNFGNKWESDNYERSEDWMADPQNTNGDVWASDLLSSDEYDDIVAYTGIGYGINSELYTVPWDEMDRYDKTVASNIYDGLSKFELHKGIEVTRICSTMMFGREGMSVKDIKKYLKENGNLVQNNGFMSFSANNNGKSVDSMGMTLRLRIPPSKGAGAYINPISTHRGEGENEFLVNSNSVIRIRKVVERNDGTIRVYADWVGQAKDQKFRKK